MKVSVGIYWDQSSRMWRAVADFDDKDVMGLPVRREAVSPWRWRVKRKINRAVLDYALYRQEERQKSEDNETYEVNI